MTELLLVAVIAALVCMIAETTSVDHVRDRLGRSSDEQRRRQAVDAEVRLKLGQTRDAAVPLLAPVALRNQVGELETKVAALTAFYRAVLPTGGV